MMSIKAPRVPLYLRLWLAVVLALALLAGAFAWLLSVTSEPQSPRQILLRNSAGEVIGQGQGPPAGGPGRGWEFKLQLNDGSEVYVQIPPRPHRRGEPPPARPWGWLRGPGALLWLLAGVSLAVALGAYPVVRRLTQRLEVLQAGLARWGEGDLSVRVDERGNDEAAALARRFNQAAERVDALLRAHKTLLANASHELRSPLARIRMAVELLGPQTQASVLAELMRNIDELDQLVGEVLLASRLDARAPEPDQWESVDFGGLVVEQCARYGQQQLDLSLHQPNLLVRGVPKLLTRLLRNLLENALRHGNGVVQVSLARVSTGDIELRVRDHGPGVPAAQRERIFEPFYRLPGASESAGGVGLGLALVQAIAQRHGGRVWCEDAPGGGACFVLHLPAQNSQI